MSDSDRLNERYLKESLELLERNRKENREFDEESKTRVEVRFWISFDEAREIFLLLEKLRGVGTKGEV